MEDHDLEVLNKYIKEHQTTITRNNKGCQNCGGDIKTVNSLFVCEDCSLVCESNFFLDKNEDVNSTVNNEMYKRKNYFKDKLLILCGLRSCPNTKDYLHALNEVKKHNFETIGELRSLIKKLRLRKARYLYKIYYDIKKKRLINLKYNDIRKLNEMFIKIERYYSNDNPNGCLKGYNVIIYHLLKHYGYKCYKYVFLPANHKFMSEYITELLKIIQ